MKPRPISSQPPTPAPPRQQRASLRRCLRPTHCWCGRHIHLNQAGETQASPPAGQRPALNHRRWSTSAVACTLLSTAMGILEDSEGPGLLIPIERTSVESHASQTFAAASGQRATVTPFISAPATSRVNALRHRLINEKKISNLISAPKLQPLPFSNSPEITSAHTEA